MKPILFNTEMVCAILEGRKTVTRRVVKPQPLASVNTLYQREGTNIWRTHGVNCWYEFRAPCVPGDILWVRETWCESLGQAGKYFYRAYAGPKDEMKEYAHSFNRWRPSIHMPRKAARIFLKVTDVRVERLRDITDQESEKEGILRVREHEYKGQKHTFYAPRAAFHEIWDSTVDPVYLGLYGWDANPWVWVIEFKRISKEEAANEK